eukprot:TRINITY_DN1240_c0_g1_i29.p1 TRINITY_DN1240_c0_g1~~TRINITY_DN1240_c0_g1_i29.p1  ORF type:complete len:194 (-),score=30.12 TRINITY_DN1240_c0_g1_i29:943-1524(-)
MNFLPPSRSLFHTSSNDVPNPIDEILYGTGNERKEAPITVQSKELAVLRSNYRRKYLERYCKARSAIRAPEKNENAYSVAVPQVYRQCFESNRKCSDEQISDAIIPALQVTVIVPSQSLPKSEIPVTDEVKVPLIEEESKQNQSSTTNFSEEDSPKDSISKTPVTATTLGTNFLIDLMGNPLNGLKLKPLVLS